MKLIQIFALVTAMASVAAGQNAGTSGNTGAQSKPSPTPAGEQKPGTKPAPAKSASPASKPAPAKSGSAAAAKSGATSAKSTSPATTKSGSTPAAAKKNEIKTGVLPEKKTAAHTPAVSVPAASAGKTSTQGTSAGVNGKATPTTKAGTPPAQAASKTGAAAAGKSATTKTAAVPAAPKPAAKSSAGATTTPSTKKKTGPAVATATKKPVPPTSKKATAKPVPPAATAKATAPPAVPEKKPAPRLIGAAGRRDPFVSPIRSASAVSPTQNCTSGKRCLAIPELTLQGTVRDISGKMMAVVATSTHRTYTLRENDQVFNGSVEKITSDSIIFREYVKDALGRESAKEVVKKMGPTS